MELEMEYNPERLHTRHMSRVNLFHNVFLMNDCTFL